MHSQSCGFPPDAGIATRAGPPATLLTRGLGPAMSHRILHATPVSRDALRSRSMSSDHSAASPFEQLIRATSMPASSNRFRSRFRASPGSVTITRVWRPGLPSPSSARAWSSSTDSPESNEVGHAPGERAPGRPASASSAPSTASRVARAQRSSRPRELRPSAASCRWRSRMSRCRTAR
ncbi:hypothetical protein BE08_07225 [Sorangium cellulosum]|uniref:Uncharacterized protein n=1 Tax=Sorangium cellulosum TaxID=56 RepID=A0A150P515_SORCE|nr:hypothetical protein BE08_07225 [Sorangium cellulosum]